MQEGEELGHRSFGIAEVQGGTLPHIFTGRIFQSLGSSHYREAGPFSETPLLKIVHHTPKIIKTQNRCSSCPRLILQLFSLCHAEMSFLLEST